MHFSNSLSDTDIKTNQLLAALKNDILEINDNIFIVYKLIIKSIGIVILSGLAETRGTWQSL
jgi:hypothetical protein